MFAKTLVKLIDYAIFPAVLIVATKIAGIAFFSQYFDTAYQVEGARLVFNNVQDFISVNSYSSLFMFFAVIAGLLWVTIKARLFHDTHISPSFSAKLFGMNLNDLIHTTETIYSQSFIWLSYAWIISIVFGVQSYYGLAEWWIFYISLISAVLATALLVLDIETEFKKDEKIVGDGLTPSGKVMKFAEEVLSI
ncbi:hypothetical protein CO178_01960 [candidate division WWE3 bacterium CG_4_9_14_3_um_filter_34_6]|uniref:Uncharacterized protein n=1 Tax=candidate division WWE3 bacterium CG_4_9_14_3_um_filter_34_6 TaxID=1975079 RepID=A0A2M7X383_UNCKA|nr:MAG: hypothetical protein CO178_01960 [candidate division WWE3 bacterium CG_4_9_14_3_um_filter_34_6]